MLKPLRGLFRPAVVLCIWSILLMPGGAAATPYWNIGMTGSQINENENGTWRNVRLSLTFVFGDGSFRTGMTPQVHPEWAYTFGLYDHLVYQNLDDPNDTGRAIPLYAVREYRDNDDGMLGTIDYHEGISVCWESDDTPLGWCDSTISSFSTRLEADILITLPACGRFRIYYLMDGNEWLLFCGPGMEEEHGFAAMRTILHHGMGIVGRCVGLDTNLVHYIHNQPGVEFSTIDIDMGACPDPPPPQGEPEGEFVGYVDPRGGDGRDWLPTPGDSIGLVFEVTTSPPGALYSVAYHIWDMSMWKGECMNSPRYDPLTVMGQVDPEPATTGFSGQVPTDSLIAFRNFDFTVAEPSEYNYFYVRDTLGRVREPRNNLWAVPGDTVVMYETSPDFGFAQTRPLFMTTIIASDTTRAQYDTLWLKFLDYGAHCIVTPEYGGGKDRRLRSWEGPYDQELWSVTVPYDYDGYSMPGVNFGDGMADRWEEHYVDIPSGEDIRYFRPFVTPHLGVVDFDSLPEGRGIDGDQFCNFAEYRGLMVAKDSTDVHYNHVHRRLNPNRKTVIGHVRENMDNDEDNESVLDLMPGYIYKLQLPSAAHPDTVEIYFSDSIRFRPEKTLIDDNIIIEDMRFTRRLFSRHINYNKNGSALWYYGFGAPTPDPMSGEPVIRAVTFWSWEQEVELEFLLNNNIDPDSILGHTYAALVFGDTTNGASIPYLSTRTVVNLYKYNKIKTNIYGGDTPEWMQDFPRECSRTIAHEFGHSIGMLHPLDSMITSRKIMSMAYADSLGFIIADSVYSDSSKSQFSIKGE